MPSAHHQMSLNVPTAENKAVPACAFRDLKDNHKQPSGIVRRSTATNIQEVKFRPETTGILNIIRGFPRLLQANDVTGA